MINAISHGEDINENLQEFLQLSSEFDQLLSVKRLDRLINKARHSKYFSYFGCNMRWIKYEDKQNLELKTEEKKSLKQLISSMLMKSKIENPKTIATTDSISTKDIKTKEVLNLWKNTLVSKLQESQDNQENQEKPRKNKCIVWILII